MTLAPSAENLPFSRPARIAAGMIATLAWAALALQLVLIIHKAVADGGTAAGAIANFVSFFTILTNTLVAVTLTRVALGRAVSASLMGATTIYIVVVGIIYSLFLRALWNPTGWQKVADMALHDAMPLLGTLFWLVFVAKGRLRFGQVPAWLIYPLAYLGYSLVRGAWMGWYPYPFVNAATLGYGQVAVNAAALTLFFTVLGLALVALDRLLGRLSR